MVPEKFKPYTKRFAFCGISASALSKSDVGGNLVQAQAARPSGGISSWMARSVGRLIPFSGSKAIKPESVKKQHSGTHPLYLYLHTPQHEACLLFQNALCNLSSSISTGSTDGAVTMLMQFYFCLSLLLLHFVLLCAGAAQKAPVLSAALSPAAAAFIEGKNNLPASPSRRGRGRKGSSQAATNSAQAQEVPELMHADVAEQLPQAPVATTAGSKRKANELADDEQRQVKAD